MSNLDAIVIGMGPSFYEWYKDVPKDRSIIHSYDPNVPMAYYGTGKVSEYPIRLTGYCYACPPKRPQVPADLSIVWARPEVCEEHMVAWPDHYIRGGSAGSMALCLACYHGYEHIGLIGFDGFGMPDYFVSEFRGLLRYWRSQGKVFYTLMPESLFDDLLRRPE